MTVYTVSTQATHPAVQQLARCIEFLRSVCDGAVSRDQQGFSSFDKNLGHYLADKLADHEGWSREDLGFAVQLAWRYRAQLGQAGLSFPTYADLKAEIDDLPDQDVIAVAPTASTAAVRMWLDANGWLVLAFSAYDHAKLAELMTAVPDPDRWWDSANLYWLIRPVHADHLADMYGVTVEPAPADDGSRRPDPTMPRINASPTYRRGAAPAETVEITEYDDDRIEVRCPFAMKDALKAAVPWKSREWSGATKTWIVDRAYQSAVQQALGLA